MLFVLALVGLCYLLFRYVQVLLRKRRCDRLMSDIEARLARVDDAAYYREANVCLKSLLVRVGGRKGAASLAGEAWAQVLAEPDPGKWAGISRIVAEDAYKSHPQKPDRDAVLELMHVWIIRSVESQHA